MILIVSDRLDLHAYAVMLELDQLGARYGLFNVADHPLDARVTQTFDPGGGRCQLELDGGDVVEAADVTAVWYRKPGLARLHPELGGHEKSFAFDEIVTATHGLYDALGHAYWISPVDALRAASLKPRQLRAAAALGMAVPRTILTNDEAEARAFVSSVAGPVVYKAVRVGALYAREGPWDQGSVAGEVYTTRLDEPTLRDGLSRLRACPALLQEYVDKEVELRVTVVGDAVFTAEIHSQAEAGTRVDWRRGDPFAIEHRVHLLPAEVADQCRTLVRRFGLRFGAIDLIKTVDGRYVFLELNPNGQYGWVEKLTGLPISRAIAEQLAHRQLVATGSG
jgi:hypothetical protein